METWLGFRSFISSLFILSLKAVIENGKRYDSVFSISILFLIAAQVLEDLCRQICFNIIHTCYGT